MAPEKLLLLLPAQLYCASDSRESVQSAVGEVLGKTFQVSVSAFQKASVVLESSALPESYLFCLSRMSCNLVCCLV